MLCLFFWLFFHWDFLFAVNSAACKACWPHPWILGRYEYRVPGRVCTSVGAEMYGGCEAWLGMGVTINSYSYKISNQVHVHKITNKTHYSPWC